MNETSTDRIEKEIVVRAPRARVWRAITDAQEFGKWFQAEGTRLKVTESGFDQIPLLRRSEAFRRNSEGWAEQVQNVARYVGQTK